VVNSSQFTLDETGDGVVFGFEVHLAEARFRFLWKNQTDAPALINVDGYLTLDGVCSAITKGGWFVFGNTQLSVFGSLQIQELWNNPPTWPIEQPSQTQYALDLRCDTFGIAEPANVVGGPLFRSFDLQYSNFAMPPGGTAMFEVACVFNWSFSGNIEGEIQAVFQEPHHQVMCPGVLLTILPSTLPFG
jgi:hypothetical protein